MSGTISAKQVALPCDMISTLGLVVPFPFLFLHAQVQVDTRGEYCNCWVWSPHEPRNHSDYFWEGWVQSLEPEKVEDGSMNSSLS